jgi:hypothetical protein
MVAPSGKPVAAPGSFPGSPVAGDDGRLYLFCMSLSGSLLVFRNELEVSADPHSRLFRAVEWLVDFHGELLLGETGRQLSGMGATFLTLLCLTGVVIWWPGIARWRRSLAVKLEIELCQNQLGPAQCARILVSPLRNRVGNLWNLLLFPSAVR